LTHFHPARRHKIMPGGADFPFFAFYGIINSAVSGMHRNVLMQKLFFKLFHRKTTGQIIDYPL
jgi:hypothetical protein